MPKFEESCKNFAPWNPTRTDVWNGSNWCSDPNSSHSNEKILKIQASCFNKVDNVDSISSFLTKEHSSTAAQTFSYATGLLTARTPQ